LPALLLLLLWQRCQSLGGALQFLSCGGPECWPCQVSIQRQFGHMIVSLVAINVMVPIHGSS
jgi:hypothetical protein